MKYNANLPLKRHPFLCERSKAEFVKKRYSGKREKAPENNEPEIQSSKFQEL